MLGICATLVVLSGFTLADLSGTALAHPKECPAEGLTYVLLEYLDEVRETFRLSGMERYAKLDRFGIPGATNALRSLKKLREKEKPPQTMILDRCSAPYYTCTLAFHIPHRGTPLYDFANIAYKGLLEKHQNDLREMESMKIVGCLCNENAMACVFSK
ncbi:unnamed protein product [Cylicocyclus nassatus]|uniref:Uncharacterized protein n=1 Tax=Cylicocyclus nassatus TaxID=53992 RepID=A0AA36DPG5_CYLNA|nr:unnamed protein product [Cylicocyclus nassatus]